MPLSTRAAAVPDTLRPSPPQGWVAWCCLAASVGSGLLGAWLAWHHPLSGALALVGFALVALLAARFWIKTPVLVLGPLAVLALAPWSGWITFEEMDLLVLASACGGYAAAALRLGPQDRAPAWRHALLLSAPVLLLIGLVALSTLQGLWRGLVDAGGFEFGWFQGYHEPMNAVRNSKALFEVLLLLPLWTLAGRVRPRGFSRGVLLGMVLAVLGASLATVWERMAYAGLLNLSSGYRSSGLFWEMHVGGAALDGFLVMTLPFAVLALLRTRSPWRFAVGMVVVLLGIYACLATFSRGVYLALPVSLAALVLLADAQRRRDHAVGIDSSQHGPGQARPPLPRLAKIGALLMAGAFALAAVLVFGSGGYRGLLALLAVMLVLVAMPDSLWLPSWSQRATAMVMGALAAAVLAAASWAAAMVAPQVAAVPFGLALLGCGLLRWRDRPGVAQPMLLMGVNACWFWLLASWVIAADHWGGAQGRWGSLAALLALGGLWCAMLLQPALWPLRSTGTQGWRKRSLVVGGLVMVMAVVALFGGGESLRERAAVWKQDGQQRLQHWADGLRLIHGARQWLLGKGAGRFVASHFYEGPIQSHAGDYRLRRDDTESFLALTGGKHEQGHGELFRITQRIAPAAGLAQGQITVRAERDATLNLEICERHLLNIDNCTTAQLAVKPDAAGAAVWRTVDFELGPLPSLGGSPWLPRFVSFSMAVETPGARIDIARVALRDALGTPLLVNGDFNLEMARWFFSSDRHHLPWHIKNAALHVLFEQGLVGVSLLGLAFVVALARLSFGRGRNHPLAPAIAAGLLGFAVVGAFDSLLDASRVGLVFFTLLTLGLGLRAMPGEGAHRVA